MREKPTFEQYVDWLKEELDIDITWEHEDHYNKTVPKLETQFINSRFWRDLSSELKEYDAEYQSITGYPLLAPEEPKIHQKSLPPLIFG